MPDTFPYNVFISYSSTDVSLAEKLEADLKAAGLTPFRDKSRLSSGDPWEEQLVRNLEGSQHLVLLMSKAAAASDWVVEERTRFKIMIDQHGDGALVANRRILVICLDTKSPPALSKFHAYTQYLDAADDAARAAAWKTIVADIVEKVTDKSDYVNVPVVTFAMTTGIIANSGPNTIDVPPVVPPMTIDQFLASHSINSQAELHARYGATPAEWKPFDQRNVREILDAMLSNPTSGVNVRITELQGPKEVRWLWPDLMNAGFDQFQAQIKQLRGQPLLVIVDPLSLCNGHVNTRFNQIQSWLQNREAAVIIVPPFRPQPPVALLHQWLRVRAAPLLDFYYDPPPSPNQTFTGHVVSAAEEDDILRVVKNALCSSDRVIPARAAVPSALIRA